MSGSTRGEADGIQRRTLLRAGVQMIGGVAMATPFQALLTRGAHAAERDPAAGYGDLLPIPDGTTKLPLIRLPKGFTYKTNGWPGDDLTDGTKTTNTHEGMADKITDGRTRTLIRNHEVSGDNGAFINSDITYDKYAGGGTTNMIFNTKTGELEKSWSSISGTVRNCAGGPTPWGSWLTCEETLASIGDKTGEGDKERTMRFEQDHGWIFEVPADGTAQPVPLKDMGRFSHEAVAVDPATGIVYETEDSGSAGFFRFIPNEKGKLQAGGKLQMLKIAGVPDLTGGVEKDKTFKVEWVDIPKPHEGHSPSVFHQGQEQGGTRFARLEGCWYGNERIYFDSTSGGDVKEGQIWEYTPRSEELRLVFESPSKQVLSQPDNICFSPRGKGLVCCEDSGGPNRLIGITLDGRVFNFAENNCVVDGRRNRIKGDFRGSEWAGACFSPDGKWLFANIQRPGITVAITGPWENGAL